MAGLPVAQHPRNVSTSPSAAANAALRPRVRLELADDRELVDDPSGPYGNKGGLYIESRIRVSAATSGRTDADGLGGGLPVLRVTSPTITTPLAGVPEQFRAGHYMKVLCPLGSCGDPELGAHVDVMA